MLLRMRRPYIGTSLRNSGRQGRAHAFAFAVTYCTSAPRIITDCLTLVQSLDFPVAALTSGKNPLAAEWTRIAAACNGDGG